VDEVGVAEQECNKQLINNTAGAQRRSPERRGRNVRLLIEALLVCFNYRINTYIRHRFHNIAGLVRTKKRNPIRKQHSTKIKNIKNTVISREDDEL